jgi:hypothetical protein
MEEISIFAQSRNIKRHFEQLIKDYDQLIDEFASLKD